MEKKKTREGVEGHRRESNRGGGIKGKVEERKTATRRIAVGTGKEDNGEEVEGEGMGKNHGGMGPARNTLALTSIQRDFLA